MSYRVPIRTVAPGDVLVRLGDDVYDPPVVVASPPVPLERWTVSVAFTDGGSWRGYGGRTCDVEDPLADAYLADAAARVCDGDIPWSDAPGLL